MCIVNDDAETQAASVEACRAILLALNDSISGNWGQVAAELEDATMLVAHVRRIASTYQHEHEEDQ